MSCVFMSSGQHFDPTFNYSTNTTSPLKTRPKKPVWQGERLTSAPAPGTPGTSAPAPSAPGTSAPVPGHNRTSAPVPGAPGMSAWPPWKVCSRSQRSLNVCSRTWPPLNICFQLPWNVFSYSPGTPAPAPSPGLRHCDSLIFFCDTENKASETQGRTLFTWFCEVE